MSTISQKLWPAIGLVVYILAPSWVSGGWQAVVGPVTADDTAIQKSAEGSLAKSQVPSSPKGPERIPNYVLGPEDQIVIRAFPVEELSDKPIQIANDGYINLPLVGRLKAGGLTVSDLEKDLVDRLEVYVRNPQVSVSVSDYRSEPVSVVGDVAIPGVVQLRGRKTLVEVIALAGGLKADAGNTVTITRELSIGRIPLPVAKDSPDGRFSIAHINLQDVMDGRDPTSNLLIQANDILMIPKARLVYVVGEVQRPGGYVMNERDHVTVLQAVALAGGLTVKASPAKARILYQQDGQKNRSEVPTDVRKILDGRSADVSLHAEDILFVPNSLPKSAGAKALETAISMAGVAVWRF
jgi:polysaccharide biosynthesis/export protein